ncbi:hypothetical protein V2J09_013907 [Rumex salicifolius]
MEALATPWKCFAIIKLLGRMISFATQQKLLTRKEWKIRFRRRNRPSRSSEFVLGEIGWTLAPRGGLANQIQRPLYNPKVATRNRFTGLQEEGLEAILVQHCERGKEMAGTS